MRQIIARQQEELIDRLADWIARQGLVAPAVFLLEANKPFSFLGSQALWMLQPLLGPAIGHDQIVAYAQLLQDRSSVERLLERLELRRNGDNSPAGADDTTP